MRHPAVHLAVDQQRVDGGTAIVDAHVALQVDLPGLPVHLDDRRVRAEREDEVLGVVEVRLLEAGLHPVRDVLRHVGRERDVGERQPLVRRSLDLVLAVGELHVLGRGLEQVSGDLARLALYLQRRTRDGLAADRERA